MTRKNSGRLMNGPQNSSRPTGVRRAWAQPRFLLGSAALTLAGATLVTFAAPSPTATKAPVAMPHTTSEKKAASLADLPAMMARYGEARRLALASTSTSTSGRTTRAVGTGTSGFNLVETDLTPNSPSDEREPVVSPNGDFIAFTSTGADTDNDGLIDSAPTPTHRHIWVMNRDGSGQRQLTGFGADASRDQTHPTWSPDGNQIAYADQDFSDENSVTVNQVTTPGSQLYIVDSLSSSPTPAQITFFKTENNVPAQVESPAWAPSGLSIAFVTRYDARTSTADGSRTLDTRDIFTIAPDGNPTSITRLTGDAGDPNGDTSDDDHPAWGIANSNVLFFSSNRDANGVLTGTSAGGRRIWRILSDGTSPNPVTNPLRRPNGQASDADDYPAPSTIGGTFTGAGGANKTVSEMLAFQTNTFIDNSDQTDGAAGRDLNVWSLPISSRNYSGSESRIYVSSYDDGKVTGVNIKTLQPSTVVPRLPQSGVGNLINPEGVAVTQNASGTNYVYVSDRGRDQIARFVESTGAAAGNGNGTTTFGFTPATVPDPTALALYNGYIYVASGYNSGAANTNAIYRFTEFGGNPAGNDATGLFSNGETATNGGTITNGSEGLAINSTGRFIAVSEVSDNKVNLYDANSGAYLFNAADNTSLVPANGGGLNTPTGLVWGPDANGDSYEDLYVCSSGNDSIKVYAGPNPVGAVFANVGSAANTRPGTLIATLIADQGNGTGNGSTGLNGPEAIDIQDLAKHGATASDTQGSDGTYEIYVSSFRTLGVSGNGVPGGGYQVNRYELSLNTTTPANSQALPWPAGSGAPLARPSASDPMVNAAWISLPGDPQNPTASGTLAGAGGFAFNFTALNQGVTTTNTADETASNVAVVQTNILSSPKNFSDSRLTAPQTVDRAADGQPAYSRTAATAQTLARLVFVSGRKYTPSTASNGSTTPVNPNGGDGTYLLDSNTPIPNITHDIWAASTKDTTPPALVPQGAGNLQYPVVAPQPNAPYFAPRTAEAGLKPNITPVAADSATEAARAAYTQKGGLRFAVVLRDVESGLNETTTDNPTTLANASVTISLFNADARNFQTYRNDVDENIHVQIAQETKASRVSINAQSSFPLNVYDDGPVSGGGHEQQAGAVAGDGVYYCEALVPTPGAAGDFYIDLSVKDRQNNAFTYDNIWGISTRRFTRTATNYNLFVSDYTCGQNFPLQLTSDFDDPRYANMPPVESYYLTNPGGTVYKSNDPASADFNVVLAVSTPETFSNVDVWRTLCRGPVTQDVLNAYRPTITKQIDPNTPYPTAVPTATPTATATPLPGSTATPIPAATATPTAGPSPTPTGTPEPFTQLTRPVAVASTAVIWGAPYAGTTFVGPGTITDSTTQAALTSYLQDGGRLFISGRDIARALTLTTGGTNSFLTNELAATFNSNEASSLTIAPGAAPFVTGTYSTLEFPYRPTQSSTDANHFNDAAQPAINPDPNTIYGPGNYLYDIISSSGAAGTEVAVAYNQGGTVGQRVENTRANGIRSRLVFFSFGFESVNRRYRQPTTNDGTIALNIRRNIALNILEYFRTSSVSGTVSTASSTGGGNTNVVVPNFLLRIDGPGGPYLVRTDANGNYFVSGLTSGTYTVRPYTITKNGVATTLPEGYFGGTPVTFGVGGGGTTRNVNLTVVKAIPGGIIGKAVASSGTFNNRADDTPIPNLPVLVRSVGKSSAFPNSGKFAKLGTTNATGDFSISGVPALAEMEVIFNPNVEDIPAGSGISYSGPNTNYGRRIVPDSKRPNNAIIVPSGDNFVLNDTGTVTISGTTYTVDTNSKPDTAADERVPVLVPVGPTISGVISVNNTPVSGATVQLFPQGSATPVPNVQTSGTGGKTGTNGAYSFVDVTPGNYTLTASILRDGITFVRSTNFTLVQGTDQTQNINFTIATLTGKVVQGNNVPVANATVTLQNANGTNFVPARTAKTNAQGIYTIVTVPVGGYTYVANSSNNTGTATFSSPTGNANYRVFASSGTLTGSSPNFAVSATSTTVTVPTIQLTNQQLAGVVKLQVDANQPILNLAGATVELLDGNGNSFSPQRTTTSASDGSYGFTITATGTYRVKATYRGDVIISNAFTASPGPSTGPTLLIRLRTVYGTTFDSTKTGSDGKPLPVGGVSLSLLEGSTVLATTTSNSNGSFTFPPVKAGSGYVINAVKSGLAGTAQVPTLTRTASPAVGVAVYMVAKSSFTPNPTSFVKGRTYSISMPYETSANATTRNIYDLTRGDATVALTDVFNYDPVGVNASGKTVRFYTVSRFNPNTLAYEAIPDNGVLRRGEGYLLNVTDTPANGATLELQMPSDNPALKALTQGTPATTQQFYVYLAYNDSLAGNTLNGRNLIGFGFDPAKFSRVVWDTTNAITDPNLASVQVLYGSQRYTLKQAVDAGVIYPTLTTIDGTTGRTVSANSINAYGGYFVTARKAGIRLLLRLPQSN